jgi:hypothetical protein
MKLYGSLQSQNLPIVCISQNAENCNELCEFAMRMGTCKRLRLDCIVDVTPIKLPKVLLLKVELTPKDPTSSTPDDVT